MSGDGGKCVLCWAPVPQPVLRQVDSVLKRFLASTKPWMNHNSLSCDGVSCCKKCLSDVSWTTEKGEEVAEMEGKVRRLQRELLEHLRVLVTLTDNYLRRMSTLEGTIKSSPPPEKLLGRGRRQRRGTGDSSIRFRDSILRIVEEVQRCKGELGSRLEIPQEIMTISPSQKSKTEEPLQLKIEVEIASDEDDGAGDHFKDYDDDDSNPLDPEDDSYEGLADNYDSPYSPDEVHEKDLDSDTEKNKTSGKQASKACRFCKKTFTRTHDARRHEETMHQKQNWVPCANCQDMVLPHRMEYHKQRQCARRNQERTTNSNNSKIDEILEKIPEKKEGVPKCPICHKLFDSWELVKNHQRYSHQTRVPCPDCHKKVSPDGLEKHQTNRCLVKNPQLLSRFNCSICHKKFDRVHDAKRHEQQVHKFERGDEVDPQTKNRSEMHPCPECGQSFRTPLRLKRHINFAHSTAGNTDIFKCPTCSASFRRKIYLKRHQRRVHERKPYLGKPKLCKHCDKWISSNGFSSHVRYHCAGRPKDQLETVVCEGCGVAIKSQNAMYRHKRTCPVLGLKGDFRCEFCGKGGFATEKYLELHMERHKVSAMTTKPYLCMLCGRGFNNNSNLRRHTKLCDGTKKPRGPRSNMLKPLPITTVHKKEQSTLNEDS